MMIDATRYGFDVVYFQSRGVVTHKNTPDDIVMRLHDIYKRTLEDETVKKKFYNMVVDITYAGPAEYGKENEEEDKIFEKIIRAPFVSLTVDFAVCMRI